MLSFDVVVVGGGHAGCEAAAAAAKIGRKTTLISLDPSRIGVLSCNPAMGGLAKGQLIKEIDALGGLMGINTDATAIQYRKLNSSKGPAVRSSRAQCDKNQYSAVMKQTLAQVSNLQIVQGEVVDVLVRSGRVFGVRLSSGEEIATRAVVITSGTFLRGLMFTGFDKTQGGRVGDAAAVGLTKSLHELGFRTRRLKTGTPPRLRKSSIDFSKCEQQLGDSVISPFSFYGSGASFPALEQVPCFITHTNAKTHDIIAKNFDRSPMFRGLIEGVGPRYCPSIEDKVKRFSERDRHQIFLEPEGLDVEEIYVNGVSTSLPSDVQDEFIHTINGLERAEFLKYGYAVEYDAVEATQLGASLQAKDIKGLFFAGQVNGTSGYEEAGAQGLMAGINAARMVVGGPEVVLGRNEAYIGVLIDDLVTRGSDEPYRMFTSRAEFRLYLREDNADQRLSPLGRELGLLGFEAHSRFLLKLESIERLKTSVGHTYLLPSDNVGVKLQALGTSPLKDRVSLLDLIKRPEIGVRDLADLAGFDISGFSAEVLDQVEISIKYAGYIQRDLELAQSVSEADELKIPSDFNFGAVGGLSSEIQERVKTFRPETLGQMGRIQGVTPAALASVLIHLKMPRGTK